MVRVRKVAAVGLVLVWSAVACGRKTPSNVPLGGQDDPSVPSAEEDPTRSVSEGSQKRSPPPAADEREPEEEPDTRDEPEPFVNDLDEPDDDEDDDDPLRTEGRLAHAGDSPPAKCDDSHPGAFDCQPLTRSCPAMAPLCKMMESVLKPKVAQALVDCVSEKGCGMEGGEECARDAMRTACVDDAARDFCEERHQECRAEFEEAQVSREDCEYAVSALLPDVRKEFTACLAQTCDPEPCLFRVMPGGR